MKKLTLVGLILASFLCVLPQKAEAESFKVSISGQDSQEYPVVDMSFKVLDLDDAFMKDVQKEDVRILVDQVPVRDFGFLLAGRKENLSVILALDVSGSMKGDPLKKAIASATHFVEGLSSEDNVALCVFSDEVRFYHDFTRDLDQIKSDLSSLSAVGNTALYDAIYECVEFANVIPSQNKAVIVLSDGNDTYSKVELGDCIAFARQSGTPVYSIGFAKEESRGKLRKTLGRLSKLSDGSYFFIPSLEELSELYELIREQLKNDYQVEFRVPEKLLGARKHEILLEINYRGLSSRVSSELMLPEAPTAPIVTDDNTMYFLVAAMALFFLLGGGFVILAYFLLRRARKGSRL